MKKRGFLERKNKRMIVSTYRVFHNFQGEQKNVNKVSILKKIRKLTPAKNTFGGGKLDIFEKRFGN